MMRHIITAVFLLLLLSSCMSMDSVLDGKIKGGDGELKEGLVRTHFLDIDRDGEFETQVCEELISVWEGDKNLRIRDQSFGFAYRDGETPCEEIDPFDRWGTHFAGLLQITNGTRDIDEFEVDIDADVNDGIKMVISNESNTEVICNLELWKNVPEFDNYHSTDAYYDADGSFIEHGCETKLTENVLYPVEIDFYHESDSKSSNDLFNRAYLDLWLSGLRSGDRCKTGRISFYHTDEHLDGDDEPAEYIEGLARTHYLDIDRDGEFETEVCEDLSAVWEEDDNLRIRDRSFGFSYPPGDTPCEEIDSLDRWSSTFEGYLKMTLVDDLVSVVDVEFNADVNDGVSLVVMNPEGTVEICRMELWQDVPEYDNYHSTDAYDPEHGCIAALTSGVYYPMTLKVYHESDESSPNWLFNRAYLDMFYWGLPSGARIEFYRDSE